MADKNLAPEERADAIFTAVFQRLAELALTGPKAAIAALRIWAEERTLEGILYNALRKIADDVSFEGQKPAVAMLARLEKSYHNAALAAGVGEKVP
ncbi:hypothetical protein HZB07_03150 [Candidatus Saganbacteria bacterium]|nr:hypothetical protein [Candidatus Saganbacteria bacterium]